ncbi:DUF2268 domain-containing putative Zn-dependent protease [Chryseobacterium sp. MEBOG07]|uniref:DUF2268 domain-containing putative Zn-dependent protease n=1 Tax=Chryseobacterium sp. MEBOG07 TaxID=2879939 RepID=UPI001F42C62B|nr:DUF2268 domain-containing putative Zn-dependent protease [Chryseobacterium sp. MEBOG07]UKB80308.1 DUF2268 domain-containing protein [Chryseobacterium sp. MEBOG07]
MKRSLLFLLPLTFLLFSTRPLIAQNIDLKKIEQIPDSVKIENIVILNLFKHQLLAHKNNQYDSTRIVNNVYLPHKKLWDSCYGVIFGEENARLFNNPKGMISWNKTLYRDNKKQFEEKIHLLLGINIEKTFKKTLTKFRTLVPFQPKAKISLLFTPLTGIAFGGCNDEQFALELNNKGLDILYALEKGLPHELNHLVYEHFRKADPDGESALSQTIDEGFACYFAYVFFDRKIGKYEAVENMTQENWAWYIKNEKEIFTKLKPYFSDTSGNNPLLRNDQIKLFPEAQKSINYWLGFRIIEKYVEKHGSDSWKDVYNMTPRDLLEKSGYEKYIESL